MASRIALLATSLLLVLAAPAAGHVNGFGSHRDTRVELRNVTITETVETVEAAAGTAGEGLPETWCGTERHSDDVDNAAYEPSMPQFKVVYAHATDRANRFAQWQDAIQANVSLIGRFLGAQSGGRRTPRFDMGTHCGAEYVDVQVVELPGPRAAYVDDFDALELAVRDQLTHDDAHKRNVLVFADRLSSEPSGSWWGLGRTYLDETPGSANASNLGDLFSALWIPDAEPAPGVPGEGWWPEGMLHEMTHNLGAVQDGAPHSTLAGHCTDGFDVMCYADGGFEPYQPGVCEQIPGVMTQVYDCGNDDYFNVAPPAGTYLATAWNVYDNVFLGSCTALAPACGAEGGAIPAPPVATADPQVFGAAYVGRQLTATTGSWLNSPQQLSIAWEQGDGDAWEAIPGATSALYVPTGDDLGRKLRVRVVAGNADGSTVAYSQPTGVVTEVPVATPPPPAPPAPPAEGGASGSGSGAAVTGATTGRAALKIAVGRGRGKRLGTVRFAVAAGRLKAQRTRVRLAKGRYDVALCTTAGASTTTPKCVTRRVRLKRGGRVRTPALSVPVPAGASGRASLTVTAIGRLFAARTAKRPAVGVLLRG